MSDYIIDPHAEYERMGAIYTELKTMIDEASKSVLEQRAPAVSAWSVGQQVEHTLIASGMMLKAPRAIHLGRGQDEEGPNRIGVMVMRTERVRRGKAKAPENTQPAPTPSQAVLQTTWARSKRSHDALASLLETLPDTEGRLEHPYLGWLNALEWLRIVRVHAEHHLRLIADIQANAA
ncbi:MAG: hypothetical protein RhofKO_23610 [Rhodothermales bacterium]